MAAKFMYFMCVNPEEDGGDMLVSIDKIAKIEDDSSEAFDKVKVTLADGTSFTALGKLDRLSNNMLESGLAIYSDGSRSE